jgi:tripartite-type tricarboxylate transporter receptor subunit TctC
MGELRSRLRKAGASFKVAKNRLAMRAVEGTQAAGISDLFKGPTGIAYSKDPVAAPKVLVAYAKDHPGLNFGSVGIGSSQHLAGEYFAQTTGVKMTHVPYRNIAQYGPDLIAGAVPLGFQWFPNIAGPLQAQGAIALAVAGDNRLPAIPDTPTTTEAGFPKYKERGWFALFAPAKTPRPIVERLNKEMADALRDPVVKTAFEKAGAETLWMPLDQVKKWHHDEIAKYRDIITRAGIQKIE